VENATKREAELEAARLRQQVASGEAAWLGLPAEERDELLRFHGACAERGIGYWGLLRAYDPREIQLCTASPALSDVINELIAAKSAAGRSKRYTDILRVMLKGFAEGRSSQKISGITITDIDRWLEAKSLAGRRTYKSRLATLFNFAVKRGYLRDNPCDAVEVPAAPRSTPAILTVRQTARCLVFLQRREPRALGWFVLSALCGLRPEEAERTDRDAVQIDNGEAHVRVEAQTSKVRQRRIVTPLPAAVAWLKAARALARISHRKCGLFARPPQKSTRKLSFGSPPRPAHAVGSFRGSGLRREADLTGRSRRSRDFSPRNPSSRKTAPLNRPLPEIHRGQEAPHSVAVVGQHRIRFRVLISGAVLPIARISGEKCGLGSELPITRQIRRSAMRRLRRYLGWEVWPKDVTRHTAASDWLALDGNPVAVAEQLGHSLAELKTHYRALVTRSIAERFWSLIPKHVASTVRSSSAASSTKVGSGLCWARHSLLKVLHRAQDGLDLLNRAHSDRRLSLGNEDTVPIWGANSSDNCIHCRATSTRPSKHPETFAQEAIGHNNRPR